MARLLSRLGRVAMLPAAAMAVTLGTAARDASCEPAVQAQAWDSLFNLRQQQEMSITGKTALV